MQKLILSLSCSALALGVAQSASAQSTAPDEIIVTGQKITRSLQDTPVSVEVISDIQLREENIIDLVDAIGQTANVTTRDGGRFVIRGIDSVNVSGAGQGDLATIYVDGSALPRVASNAAPADFWDVSQIEIFRGPQSTLQGRASLSGAVIINTADPTYEWEGRLRAIAETKSNERRLGMAFGGPIIDDQVAFRVAVEKSKSDGFGTNVTRNEDSNPIETLIARGKLLIEPDSVDGLEVILSYSHDERTSGEAFNSLAVNDPESARVNFNNDLIRYETDINIATATVNYDLTDTWSLTSITGYNEVDYNFTFDDDRSAEPTAFRTFDNVVETWTQELRAQYDGDKLDAIFGGYYSMEDTPVSLSQGTLGLDPDLDLGLSARLQGVVPDPFIPLVVGLYPNPVIIGTDSDFTQEIETYAVFTDLTYKLNDKWTVHAGFRYDVEQQSNTNETLITIETPLPDPAQLALNPQTAPVAPVVAFVNNLFVTDALAATAPFTEFESEKFGGFLPKFGIGYNFDDDKTLTASVQRGYRSGGAAINTAQASPFEFDQEFIWNYELALRSLWLDGDLTVNANAFYIDWTDQQVRVQLSNNVFDTEIQNAGGSNVKGFEVEALYKASDTIDLQGSVGYAKTEFDEFNVGVNSANAANFSECIPGQASGFICDLSGNEFAFAPQWTLNAGITWKPTDNWIANLNANHTTASYIRGDRPQISRDSDARTLVNFRGGWQNESFGVFVTSSNLLNEDYVLTQFPNDPISGNDPQFAQFGNPRTFAVQFEAFF